MTEARVSTKTPANAAKKGKGDKERDVIGRIKDVLPQWEIQKVEAFCAEHGHDLDKIHQALDGSFERTGHQPDDWQIMTKKEQKPKKTERGGRDGGSREPRTREDRPRGERGRGRGGGDSRGRGRGGGDRGRGRGGGTTRAKDSTPATTTDVSTEAPVEAWGTSDSTPQIDSKPETTVEWGASPATTPTPPVAAPRTVEPAEKKMTWAEKFASSNARKAKVVSELQSAEAFPPQQNQQVLGPAIVHVQPQIPQAGTSYRAALQGNSRWGKKAEPVVVEAVVDTSMVAIEQQTNSLAIDSFQPAESYQQNDETAPSDDLNSIPAQETVTSSFPQAEAFQPEPAFQTQPQTDSFQIYQSPQTQPPSAPNTASEPKVIPSSVFAQAVATPTDFNSIPHNFSPDNSGKLVIELLSATNSVILPLSTSEPLSYGIEFGSFGQPAQATNFAPEPVEQQVQQPELKPSVQQPIEQTAAEPQPQLSQTPFVSNLRDDSLPVKQPSSDTSEPSSQFSQNQFYQSQTQPQAPPSQSQTQPAGYRGPPSGSFEPHYGYAFPYDNQSAYYSEFAARDSQPQSYHYTDQYPSSFRGATAPSSGGSRRPVSNANQPYYPSPTGRGGLLNGSSDGSTGNASPPTSEPVSPNSAKSASFAKPANFPGSKPPFTNPPAKIPPIPPYSTKPTAVPASNYKPPSATSQANPKSFKPQAQPQGSQSQHHPDPQHYMPYPGVYAGYPYPYPYQPPVMHPQMPYAPYDPRYGYPYPGPVQSFEGEYDYPKAPSHYSEGSSTPRGNTEWNGNADGQKPSNNTPTPSANAPSTNNLPLNSSKGTVAPGGANKKPTRFEYADQDPHFNSGYGFSGNPASSPMAMHAAAAPYQPNYGQPLMHPMGGQSPYNQYESHPRGGYGQTWQ